MSPSLSCAKLLNSAPFFRGLSLSMLRRGYAAAAVNGTTREGSAAGRSRVGMVGKAEERAAIRDDSAASSAWVPDPVTGYYRPINRAAEIDAAELRARVWGNKARPE